MHLLEQCDLQAEAIGRIGQKVRELARRTNTSVSYNEPEYGSDLICEFPDGRRERTMADGSVVPIEPRGR